MAVLQSFESRLVLEHLIEDMSPSRNVDSQLAEQEEVGASKAGSSCSVSNLVSKPSCLPFCVHNLTALPRVNPT